MTANETTRRDRPGLYQLGVLCGLLLLATTAANPPVQPSQHPASAFLQTLKEVTPANRIISLLNLFDTCRAVTTNRAYAFQLLNTVSELGRRTGDDRLIRYCRFLRATHAKNSTPSNARKAALFLTVADQARQDDDPQLAAVCQHFAGQYYFSNEEYGKAFEHLLAANKTFRELGPERVPELSRYLYELAFNYYHFADYEKAIRLLDESTRYPVFNENLAIQTYNTMGRAYTRISDYKNPGDVKRAEQSYHKARQTAALYRDSLWIGITYASLADIYTHQRRWDVALAALRVDYRMGLKFGAKLVLPNQTALNMAAVYGQRQQWDSCARFLRQSMVLYRRNLTNRAFTDFGRNLRDDQFMRDFYDVSRQYYRAIGEVANAYAYADSLTRLSDEINRRYNSRQVSLAEEKLLILKHQLTLAAIEKEKATQQGLFWLAGTVLALLTLLLYLRYRFAQHKHWQERVIGAEKEKSLRLEKQIVEDELQRARADLTVFVDRLHEKNALIDTITTELNGLSEAEQRQAIHTSVVAQQHLLSSSLLTNDDWDEFRRRFERVHPHFFVQLRAQFTDVSPAEERLLALSKLNISTREMSRMLGISPESLRKTRYRLRKKLGVGGNSPLSDLLTDGSQEAVSQNSGN